MPETTRVCSICQERKLLDEFPDLPPTVRQTGKRHQCHPCWSEWEAKCQASHARQRDLGAWVERERAKARGAAFGSPFR